jgi:Family of unknown function (DUF6352)
MPFFWGASGHVLLDRDAEGRLVPTDEFLKAYLARPELMPPDEACDAERVLHASLMSAPARPVTAAEIAALADADAAENWRLFIAFRDRLMAAPSLEAAYVGMISQGISGLPPLFLDQLVQLILRNALDDTDDAFIVRAAEALFRPQRVTTREGRILLADEGTVSDHENDVHASPLLAMLGGETVAKLDVLTRINAEAYWARSDLHDMVFDLGGEPSGRAALASVLEIWVRHLLGIEVSITAQERIEDRDWRWFVGLDQDATRIGNALWRAETIEPEEMSRVTALFSLVSRDETAFDAALMGSPVYLILATDKDKKLRMKPQNLIAGLPLAVKA